MYVQYILAFITKYFINFTLQKKIRDCNRCRCLIEESEELNVGDKGFKDSSGGTSVANGISSEDELDICHRVNELEVELGLTKFSLVEAECRNQVIILGVFFFLLHFY